VSESTSLKDLTRMLKRVHRAYEMERNQLEEFYNARKSELNTLISSRQKSHH